MSAIKSSWKALLSLSLVSSIALSGAAFADDSKVRVHLAKPKISKSLKELAKPLPVLTEARKFKMLQSGDKVPGINKVNPVPNQNYPFGKEYQEKNLGKDLTDPVLQKSSSIAKDGLRDFKMATVGVGFDGMGNVTGAVPPDTNADVGPNHIVQTVNTALAVYDKAGNELVAPVAINTLWAGFGGLCESTNRGDPIVLYDSQADRWLISQFAFPAGFTDNRNCIAISQTGDPTGAYYLYDFLYSDVKFNDYPHYGVWTDGYYAGINQFSGSPLSFAGSGVVAFERDAMLQGQAAQQVIFDLETTFPNAFTPMPADIDGPFLPPAGMAAPFVTADNAGEMNIWKFTVDWATPANSTFELASTVTVAPYNGAVCGFSRDCIVQPNAQRLDVIGQRMMFRAAYRNLNGVNKLVANHTVVGSATDNNIAGVRWYEFDLANDGTATLANNGTYNLDDGNSRWMGSAAMDAVGNIGVAYSVSGPTLNPSIRFSGRLAGDPADTLTLPETELKAGEGAQQGANRWGDYSSLSVDPVDDCTMWYTTEYYTAANNNSTGWQTYIGSFKFDNCVAGPAGEISGTVTNQADGAAIANVQVTIGALTVTTDADGNYSATLPVDTGYSVTASRYGWISATTAGIDVAEDAVVDVDFVLEPAPPVTVTGTVTDGSGLGGNLYAEVVVQAPGATISTFTDPVTGQYSLDLFEGTLVQITAMALVDGYLAQSADILPENTPVQDFALLIDGNCTADGYEFQFPAFFEGFDAGVPPTGWTVADNGATGEVWSAASGTSRGNLLGTGEAAAIDSDRGGNGVTSSTLTSPVINVADLTASELQFSSWFRTFAGGDVYNVEISVDGGAWVSILTMVPTNAAERLTIDLSAQITGATSFQLRWNYEANFEWYAYVDDIQIGETTCVTRSGSVVKGAVVDANTGNALNGATVTVGRETTNTVATPEDDSVVDGYFSIFVPDTETEVTVSANLYADNTVAASAIALATPIELDAGLIEIAAELAATDVTQGREGSSTVSVANEGNVDANYTFILAQLPPSGSVANKATGPFHPSSRHFGPKNLGDLDTKKVRHKFDYASVNIPESTVEFAGFFPVNGETGFPWGIGFNQDNDNFWVGDLLAGGAASDTLYQYDATGTFTGNTIDNSEVSAIFAADMAYNNRTGMFWQVEVGDANCIHEIDPVGLTVTGNQICPAFGTSQRGLAYDPLTNTFYSGSWNDSIIHQFTTDGTLLRSVNVGQPVSGLAINPVNGSLYAMLNGSNPTFDVVVFDTATPDLLPISAFNFPNNQDFTGDGVNDDLLPDGIQSGLAIDCDGNLWTPVRAFGGVIGVRTGETNICEWKELSWLKLNTGNSGLVAANSSADVELGFNATELEPGTYQAQLITANDTPYGDSTSLVTLNVTAPNFGSLGITTTEASEKNGDDVVITVSRAGGSDFAVTVDYQTADGTAVAGENYQDTSGTLTWADGDTADKTITVTTLNTSRKADLGLSLVLTNAQGGASLGNSEIGITIEGDSGGSFGLAILTMLGLLGLARRRRYA